MALALAPSCRPAAQIPTKALLELYGEISARNTMHDTKEMHDRYWECRKELEKRIGPDDAFIPQTPESREAAQSSEGEFAEMMEYLGKISSAKTNGEAMGAIASFRHKTRFRLIKDFSVPFSDKEIEAMAETLKKFLEVLPRVSAQEAIAMTIRHATHLALLLRAK